MTLILRLRWWRDHQAPCFIHAWRDWELGFERWFQEKWRESSWANHGWRLRWWCSCSWLDADLVSLWSFLASFLFLHPCSFLSLVLPLLIFSWEREGRKWESEWEMGLALLKGVTNSCWQAGPTIGVENNLLSTQSCWFSELMDRPSDTTERSVNSLILRIWCSKRVFGIGAIPYVLEIVKHSWRDQKGWLASSRDHFLQSWFGLTMVDLGELMKLISKFGVLFLVESTRNFPKRMI